MPSRHANSETKQHVVSRREGVALLEQQIPHPERQHRAETVTDKLKSFEKSHEKGYCLRPRSRSSGSTLGSRPRKARYIAATSSVPPRERIISRKRSPFARVRPPCSLNQ